MKRIIDIGLTVITCPVCGKEFVPAPQHVYHLPFKKYEYVCGYSCARRAQKAREELDKAMTIFWCHEKDDACGLYVVAMTRGRAKKLFANEVDCSLLDIRSRIVKRGAKEVFEGVIETDSPLLEKYGLRYDEEDI
jgi:hypothetical protein